MKTIESPSGKSFLEITKAEIKALLAFVSKDSTRPQIGCVYFAEEPEKGSDNIDENIGRVLTGSVVAVATDGHTLIYLKSAKRTRDIASAFGYLHPERDPGWMVPRDDLEKVAKMLTNKSNALISFDLLASGAKIATISANGAEMTINCVAAKYVPYEKVIPAMRAETTSSICDSVGISAKYLGRLELVTDALDLTRTSGVKLQMPHTELDPLRFDASNRETSAIVVIMPMRI